MTASAVPTSFSGKDPWQDDAACRGMDTALFYPADGERAVAAGRRSERAKAVCRSCPVMISCRRDALARGERWGVWGGLTADERALLLAGRRADVLLSAVAQRTARSVRAATGAAAG